MGQSIGFTWASAGDDQQRSKNGQANAMFDGASLLRIEFIEIGRAGKQSESDLVR